MSGKVYIFLLGACLSHVAFAYDFTPRCFGKEVKSLDLPQFGSSRVRLEDRGGNSQQILTSLLEAALFRKKEAISLSAEYSTAVFAARKAAHSLDDFVNQVIDVSSRPEQRIPYNFNAGSDNLSDVMLQLIAHGQVATQTPPWQIYETQLKALGQSLQTQFYEAWKNLDGDNLWRIRNETGSDAANYNFREAWNKAIAVVWKGRPEITAKLNKFLKDSKSQKLEDIDQIDFMDFKPLDASDFKNKRAGGAACAPDTLFNAEDGLMQGLCVGLPVAVYVKGSYDKLGENGRWARAATNEQAMLVRGMSVDEKGSVRFAMQNSWTGERASIELSDLCDIKQMLVIGTTKPLNGEEISERDAYAHSYPREPNPVGEEFLNSRRKRGLILIEEAPTLAVQKDDGESPLVSHKIKVIPPPANK